MDKRWKNAVIAVLAVVLSAAVLVLGCCGERPPPAGYRIAAAGHV